MTKRIKATDPGAKVVIVTDYDDSELRRAAMDAGACDYALKDKLPDLVFPLRRRPVERNPFRAKEDV